jgi:hypothetical protein
MLQSRDREESVLPQAAKKYQYISLPVVRDTRLNLSRHVGRRCDPCDLPKWNFHFGITSGFGHIRHVELPSTTIAIFLPIKFCRYRILLSVVSKSSKPAAAFSNSPFEILSQPRSIASVTSCPASVSAMPLGVPWSKRMRTRHGSRTNKNQRRVEAPGCEFEYGLNLFPRHMKLLDNFLYARTRLKVFKNRGNRHSGIFKHPCAATSVRNAFNRWTL